jgi:hypothetical protein
MRRVTVPAPKPVSKKTKKRGEGDDICRFSTGWIVEDYLALCRDPLSDLQRWLDEDKKKPSSPRSASPTNHARQNIGVIDAHQLSRNSLHEVSGRVCAHDHQRRDRRDMPGGSRADPGRYHELQQVRNEGGQVGQRPGQEQGQSQERGQSNGARGGSNEIGSLHGYYAALIAAAWATMRPDQAAAYIRNLRAEKIQAVRSVKDRRAAEQKQPLRASHRPPNFYRQLRHG